MAKQIQRSGPGSINIQIPEGQVSWHRDDINRDVVWIDVECNRCGRGGRLGTFLEGKPLNVAEMELKALKTRRNWVCCPGPPLWWERIKRWLKGLL